MNPLRILRIVRIAIGLLVIGGAPIPAMATDDAAVEACPSAFPVDLPEDRATRRSEAGRLGGFGEICRERADYFAYYGALLLNLARPQEAAIALEKALLLAPELGGAQLDYAQALAELGELASARHLAGDVAARPDLPPGLQSWLLDQLGAWRGEGWRFAWSLDLMAGAESNLNSSPDIRFLTLSLPGGNVPLELDASEGRVSGKALKSDIAIAAAHRLGDGVIQLGAEHLARASHGLSATRQNLGAANIAYLYPLWGGQLGGRAEHTRISIGGDPAYTGTGWSLLYQLPATFMLDGCMLSLGRAGERRKFPSADHQNGRYGGALLHSGCRWAEWQLNLGLQRGEDHALDAIRLGGNQQRTDGSMAVGRRFNTDLLSLALTGSRALDRQIYSPLLGGEARRIERLTARLTWEHPLDRHWSLIGQIEQTVQNSNIELFGMRNRALYFGVRVHGR